MSWFGISVTYVRFYAGMKAQGFDRSTLPYKSRFQPYLGWYGVFSTIIVCFVRITSYSRLYCLPLIPRRYCIVQRLERVPQGLMGNGHVRYKLPPVDLVPDHVHWRTHLATHVVGPSGGHGLQVWPCRGRGGVI